MNFEVWYSESIQPLEEYFKENFYKEYAQIFYNWCLKDENIHKFYSHDDGNHALYLFAKQTDAEPYITSYHEKSSHHPDVYTDTMCMAISLYDTCEKWGILDN